jgi:hypothetical protein
LVDFRPHPEPRNRFPAWRAGMKTIFDVPPARLAESIPWNRFLGSLNVYRYGLRLKVPFFSAGGRAVAENHFHDKYSYKQLHVRITAYHFALSSLIFKLSKRSTYVEYRPVSGVFQNIDPPPPSPPSECVLPPHQRRGVHSNTKTWGRGGLPTLPGLYHSTFQPSRRGFF